MDIKEILAAHGEWLADGRPNDDPRRADLSGVSMRGADLRDADLRDAVGIDG